MLGTKGPVATDGKGIILLHMSKRQKILKKILAGSRNITFDDFLLVVEEFGFHLSRVNGSHHIFVHPKVRELVNLQMELVERYNLTLEN